MSLDGSPQLHGKRFTLCELALFIALLSRSTLFLHGDPADRLIGATALRLGAPLITAEAKLRALPHVQSIW